jgi:peptidoglycan hydrolase-like protein with peptidoglycan-binding domain
MIAKHQCHDEEPTAVWGINRSVRSSASGTTVRLGGSLALAVAAALTLGLVGAPAAGAAVADPVAPVAAPEAVEGFTPYLPQVSCDPTLKPGVAALRTMLMSTYGGRDLGVTRQCDVGGLSEHKEGRAWDWGLSADDPADKAVAQQFLDWLLAPGPNGMAAYNARRLGVMYVIWNGKIWGAYRASEGWRKYTGGESHADHIHISLAWTGAMKRTSWWTGKAAAVDYGPCAEIEGMPAPAWKAPRSTPCPAPIDPDTLTGTPLLKQGDTSAYVLQLQHLLSVTPDTGYFGPITYSAVVDFQKAHGLAVTGTTTEETWKAVRGAPDTPAPAPSSTGTQTVTAARSLPATMRYTVRAGDSLSAIAKRWRSTVAAIRSASRLSSDTIRVGQSILVPVRSGITKFTWTTLRKGDRGVAVKALQTALEMKHKNRTGFFGPKTKKKVKKLKASRGWKVNGIAGHGVWRALGA